jgi:hypothetical protein
VNRSFIMWGWGAEGWGAHVAHCVRTLISNHLVSGLSSVKLLASLLKYAVIRAVFLVLAVFYRILWGWEAVGPKLLCIRKP